jgi:ABC-type multidrug transport system ATPase subunit
MKHSELQLSDLNIPVYALSGGGKRKLSLLISNINKPKLLLLDEPTNGIDRDAARQVCNRLQYQIQRHQTLLFSSHRMDECFQICDRAIVLCSGRVYYDGTMSFLHNLTSEYYSIDVSLNNNRRLCDVDCDVLETFRLEIIALIRQHSPIDLNEEILFRRSVRYSDTRIRFICHKRSVPQSLICELLNLCVSVEAANFICAPLDDVISILFFDPVNS